MSINYRNFLSEYFTLLAAYAISKVQKIRRAWSWQTIKIQWSNVLHRAVIQKLLVAKLIDNIPNLYGIKISV
jgi:hypothetical protein